MSLGFLASHCLRKGVFYLSHQLMLLQSPVWAGPGPCMPREWAKCLVHNYSLFGVGWLFYRLESDTVDSSVSFSLASSFFPPLSVACLGWKTLELAFPWITPPSVYTPCPGTWVPTHGSTCMSWWTPSLKVCLECCCSHTALSDTISSSEGGSVDFKQFK